MASEEEERLLRLLPKLLRENPDFRRQVALMLSESLATKDDLVAILRRLDGLHEDFNRKADEDNRRFEAVLAEIARLREDFNNEIARLREDFNKLRADLVELREDFNKLRADFNKRFGGIEETLGAFVESYSIRRVVEELERRIGRASYRVRRNMSFEGREIDALVTTDGEVYVVEVSGVVRVKDVRKVREVADRVGRSGLYPGKQVKPVVAGVRFDRNAEKEAEKLQVEVVYV